MLITSELLKAGVSIKGGLSKLQAELLGLPWPLPKGWKRTIIGEEISEENASEFIRLTDVHLTSGVKELDSQLSEFYVYVLQLEYEHYYVGITRDFDKRLKNHGKGKGANWTALYRPLEVLHLTSAGTNDVSEATKIEDEVTLAVMLKYGIDKVRGGQYIFVSKTRLQEHLISKGHWARLKKNELDKLPFINTEDSWSEALERFLSTMLNYYDNGALKERREDLFFSCYSLTRYHYWRSDFEPGLSNTFWDLKGVLPVLLTFKHKRVIGSGSVSPYEVLAAALMRGTQGNHPLRRIFLLAWRFYRPAATENQLVTVERFMKYLDDDSCVENKYDSFVSVLLPELRHLLRS